jgi:putative ABC transport system substrate-binding protein
MLALACVAAAAGCIRTPFEAAPPKVARVGVLSTESPGIALLLDAFREGLGQHGYAEGRNLAVEARYAEGQSARLPGLAADLIARPVDVLFAAGSTAATAAKASTTSVPIVAVGMSSDPVATGLVASFARPGGNLTGIFVALPELGSKLVELLHEAAPDATPIAVLWHGGDPGHAALLAEVQRAARAYHLDLRSVEVSDASDLERLPTILTADEAGTTALVVFSGSLFNAHRARLADLALRSRLPAISLQTGFAHDGGLMSYGPSSPEMYRRAGEYAARILGGTQPADLPIERPSRFEFVVNVQTASALGLTLPRSTLIQATEVIR